MEKAKTLLPSTDMRIQDICDRLHFGSRSFFAETFKEITGIPACAAVLGGDAGAKVRQLGNSSRVRILSESAEMEAAKELSAEIAEKIHAAVIDNRDKIE